MKLWLLKQDAADGYDTYDSAVVAADTEDEARRIVPGSGEYNANGRLCHSYGDKEIDRYPSWAPELESVKVEYLGEAKPGTQAGEICASFNAG